jgi:hypothetical protein
MKANSVGIQMKRYIQAEKKVQVSTETLVGPQDIATVVSSRIPEQTFISPSFDIRPNLRRKPIHTSPGRTGNTVNAIQIAFVSSC